MKHPLNIINEGVVFRTDLSILGLYKSEVIIWDDEGLREKVDLTYEQAITLVEEGLVSISNYKNYSYLHLTYDGRMKMLVEAHPKFDFKGWRTLHRRYLCCDKAIPGGFCVCIVKTLCKEHGERCHGSHD